MIFEGVTAMNLKPPEDIYDGSIFGVSLFIKNASIFFYTEALKDVQTNFDGTMICSYGLKWRFRNDEK